MDIKDKTLHQDFTSATTPATDMGHPIGVRFFEDDNGKPMLETIHDLTCSAGIRTVKCPITITTPVNVKVYTDPKAKEREIHTHSVMARNAQEAEQEKINEFLNANGKVAPSGTTVINLAIKVAKERGLKVTDHKAIVRAITTPTPPSPTPGPLRG